jgi:MoaA/NifB/PqqE/SkfB family radical SAM enzyme
MRYAYGLRRFSQSWDGSHLVMMFDNVRRRHEWFTENSSPRQVANAFVALGQFALKKEIVRAWPVLVKVDISPLCNLRCTYCVHARASHEDRSVAGELLQLQSFKAEQKMSVAQFASIVDEIRGKSMAVSLYYLGDPLVHPQLDEICRLSAGAGLNSHISTNFSFRLSDERIATLVTSGLTHLTACVDGMTQESYERTRVGGRLDVVLDNLRRVLEVRRVLGTRRPKVEVQFIKFRHNLGELEEAAAWSERTA